ncbi:MAG: cytidine deaminase [Candidatus Aenigmarchaeota archaeon]|nr:cytidine deaminase [Candidatus Aenigmarchaeota archaeon]
MTLTTKDKKLIEEAKKVAKRFSKTKWKGQVISSVGAALKTKDGKIYSGPNIHHPDSGSCSICAEYISIAKAYSDGHKKIDTIVAYWYDNNNEQGVVNPCGKCREFMRLFGNPWIIINVNGKLKKVRLKEIHPFSDNW